MSARLTESTSILGQCGDGKGRFLLTVALWAAISVTVPCAGAEAAEVVGNPSDLAPARIEEIRAPFQMPRLTRPQFAARTFDIRKYGARGDGKTNSTRAFAKAIEACSASGGGKVLVPAGKWFTGAIHLKSNVLAHDCHFQGADRGIRLKSNASRGGVVEKLWFRDIRLEGIKAEAIVINTNYGAWMASKSGKTYPLFRDIRFENVTCGGAKVAASLRGTSHKPLENITLEDVSIQAGAGMRFAWVKGLKLRNVRVKPSRGKPMIFEHCTDVTTSSPSSPCSWPLWCHLSDGPGIWPGSPSACPI